MQYIVTKYYILYKYQSNMYTDIVISYLSSRNNIPLSVKHISRKLHIKKRCIISICNQELTVKKVHPSHCGSGKDSSSIFVSSKSDKWGKIRHSELYSKYTEPKNEGEETLTVDIVDDYVPEHYSEPEPETKRPDSDESEWSVVSW